MDALLKTYICKQMPDDSRDFISKKLDSEKFKTWKERVLSPALRRCETVDYFADLDSLLGWMKIDAEYAIDRKSFEAFTQEYLCGFPKLIEGCLKEAGTSGNDVDLVILTGGHSQWYFVKEMLTGKMPQFGEIDLPKVRSDPERVISVALPQETVALGMVFGVPEKEQRTIESTEEAIVPSTISYKDLIRVPGKAATCSLAGQKTYYCTPIQTSYSIKDKLGKAHTIGDQRFFTDKDGIHEINMSDTVVPALGHSFRIVDGIKQCSRCGVYYASTGQFEKLAISACQYYLAAYCKDSTKDFLSPNMDLTLRQKYGIGTHTHIWYFHDASFFSFVPNTCGFAICQDGIHVYNFGVTICSWEWFSSSELSLLDSESRPLHPMYAGGKEIAVLGWMGDKQRRSLVQLFQCIDSLLQ